MTQKSNKAGIIILRVCALFFAGLLTITVLVALIRLPMQVDIVKEAVLLEEAKPSPENDGRIVMVSGRFSTRKYAQDDEFSLTFDAPVAVRYKESFNKVSRRSSRYDWESLGDPKLLVGEATLGGFRLVSALLETTPMTMEATDFGDALASNIYTETEDGTTYISFDDIRGVEATMDRKLIRKYRDYERFCYRLADPDATYTVIAIQRGDVLYVSEELDDNSILLGTCDKDDFLSDIRKDNWTMIGICGGLALLLYFLGLLGIVFFKKKPKKSTSD